MKPHVLRWCMRPNGVLGTAAVSCLLSAVFCFRVAAADPEPVWSLTWSPLCADITNELFCARAIERAQLPEHAEVAWRSGDTLFAVTVQDTYQFVDEGPPPGREESFYPPHDARYTTFLHHLAGPRLLLLHQISGEVGHVLVIDAATGSTVKFPDCPRLGPAGSRLLVATNFVVGHNDLQIWRWRPFRTELSTGSHLWRVPSAVWRDSSSIEVTRVPTAAATQRPGDGIPSASETSILVLTDDGWREIPAVQGDAE